MAINDTASERRMQAATDLADKLKLEKRMIPRVRRLIRRMASDLEASVLRTGGAQNAERYATAFNGVIDEQYEDAKTIFGSQLFDELDEEPVDGPIWTALFLVGDALGLRTQVEILNFLRADSNFLINDFIDINVPRETAFITQTNNTDLEAAVTTADFNLVQELGRSPTFTELAEASKKQFLQHDLGRTTTISMTTTQDAAEGIKNINVGVADDFRTKSSGTALSLPPPDMNEVWDATLDSVTRPAHAVADGQLRNNGIFTVAGESLRFPGDTALGASLANVINCRCSSIFTWEEPNF